MKIIDPHVHLWDVGLKYHAWLRNTQNLLLGSLKPIQKDYLKKNYLSDSKNFLVESVVHIEAVSIKHATQEVEWLAKRYEQDSFLGTIVAGVDFLDPHIESILAFYSGQPKVKGVRQLLNWSKSAKYTAADRCDDLTNEAWIKNFQLLKKYNLSFEMQICPEQMTEAIVLIKQSPDIKIAINHAGMPIDKDLALWKKGIEHLAQHPQVYIKLSGFGMLNHHWTKEIIAPLIEHVINHFGVERCMFASNFPVDKLYSSYDHLMKNYLNIAQKHFYQNLHDLFYNNAKMFYDL